MTYEPLQGKALQAYQHADATINCFEGSVRSGKTVATLFALIQFALTGPPGTGLIAGRTQRTVVNNLVLPIQEMIGPARCKVNTGAGTVTICGRPFLLVGADNEQSRTKIQGLTLVAAYCDEVSTLPESFWDMLVSRMSAQDAIMWTTCNPEGPKHWFHRKWLQRAKYWITGPGTVVDRSDEYAAIPAGDHTRPLDLHRFSFRLEDNTWLTEHNPEYVERTKSAYSGLFYRRMILGEWAVADGMVYAGFDEAVHTVRADRLPRITRTYALGMDYGTTNPTSGILLGLGADNRLYAYDEWAPPAGTTGERSEDLQAWLRGKPDPEWLFIDPAAGEWKLQVHRDRIGRVADADNQVNDGLALVASLIQSGRLVIADTCSNLLREIPNYVWDSKAADKGEDRVVKVDDHFCDALRYAVVSTRNLWERDLPAPA